MRPDGDGAGTPGSSAVLRRDRREVPEPPRRLYPGSEVAPGRAAAGRWSEGVLTKPKPQAARYPAGFPPLSAAKCGEAEEACPNVWRGNGGELPPSLQSKRRGASEARAYRKAEALSCASACRPPVSARYPAGVAGCRDPRRYPAAVAPAGRAATPRAPARRGAPTLSAVPSPLDGGWKREHNGRAEQRGLLAPRYPARGAGRCRGAVSARYPAGVRPGRDGLRGVTATNRQKVALATAVAGEQNAAAPLRRLSCRRARRRFSFGRIRPTKVPPPPPLSCGGGTGAREPPPSPPAILRAWGGDRVCGLFLTG